MYHDGFFNLTADNHQLEVKTVCRVFKDVAKRWNDIGLKAGLKSSYLSTLSSDFPDKSAEEYLDAVVTEWFREKTVTWEKIVQLLVQIGRREEAKQVAQEHGMLCAAKWYKYIDCIPCRCGAGRRRRRRNSRLSNSKGRDSYSSAAASKERGHMVST